MGWFIFSWWSIVWILAQHVDRTLPNAILRKGTRGLYQHWSPHDIDLPTVMIQILVTPWYGGLRNDVHVITQISSKVDMPSRFLVIVGSLPPSEQTMWIPHQNVQDPSTWTLSHLFQLKQEYNNLQIKYNRRTGIVCGPRSSRSPFGYSLISTPH